MANIFHLKCGACSVVSYVSEPATVTVWICPSCKNVNRTSLPVNPVGSSALVVGPSALMKITPGQDAVVYDAAQALLAQKDYEAAQLTAQGNS